MKSTILGGIFVELQNLSNQRFGTLTRALRCSEKFERNDRNTDKVSGFLLLDGQLTHLCTNVVLVIATPLFVSEINSNRSKTLYDLCLAPLIFNAARNSRVSIFLNNNIENQVVQLTFVARRGYSCFYNISSLFS